MESTHYTRSKAHRISLVANTQSDVDPDGVALQSGNSGPVRLSVTAAEKLESLPQELAASPSAPVPGADGGVGSKSFLRAGASLSAPGGQTDPQRGQMCYPPILETTANQYETKYKLVLFDSGDPGGPPPDAAAVGECPTPFAARRPSTPRPRATSRDLTQVKSTNFYANLTPKTTNLTLDSVRAKSSNLTLNQPQAKTPNLTLAGCLGEANSRNHTSQNLTL